jgi:hypothetical protein
MKSLNLLALFVLAVGCSQPESKETPATAEAPAAAAGTPSATYAYAPRYSNDFSFDESGHADIVMKLWKQFDENKLDEGLDYFADSVMIQFPDGSKMHNTRDSVMAMTKSYRNGYSSMRNEVDVVIPLKENKNGDRWVLVWGEEYHEKNGKKDSVLLHEVWLFNKDGKISFMHQYAGKD